MEKYGRIMKNHSNHPLDFDDFGGYLSLKPSGTWEDGMIWGLGSETLTQTFWVMPCGIFDISNHPWLRYSELSGKGPS